MRKREIIISPRVTRLELQKVLENWSNRNQAELKPMGRLVRKYKTPGESMHWHINGGAKGMGTVEVTFNPPIGTVTVVVHDNRRGFWAERAYRSLGEEVKKLFSSRD